MLSAQQGKIMTVLFGDFGEITHRLDYVHVFSSCKCDQGVYIVGARSV